MKVLRYLAAFAVVVTVFVAGGMAAASAQESSMQAALQQQAAQQAALQSTVVKDAASVQAAARFAEYCQVTPDAACNTSQGVALTILPPGVTPPTTTPPPSVEGEKEDDGGNKGTNAGGTKGLVKTGPSATGWAAIVGIAFVQLGMVVLIRGQRWTRSQLAQLA